MNSKQLWKKLSSRCAAGLPLSVKTWLVCCFKTGRDFYRRDVWARDVAALTFATFMALIPAMAFLFVVAREVGFTALLESWLHRTFETQPVVADTITDFVQNYIANTQSNYIIGVGAVMLCYTLISLMQKIERIFDDIWQTGERSWKKIVTEYPIIFLGLSILVFSSSAFNIGALKAVENVERYADIGELGDTLSASFLHAVSIGTQVVFFVFCYYIIPNTRVRLSCTLIPSLLAGISMSLFQYGYIYLQVFLSSYNVIYGSLAALPLFLLWLEVSWAIALYGAMLCHAYQERTSQKKG